MSSSTSRSKVHHNSKQSSSNKSETISEKKNVEKRSRSESVERNKASVNLKKNDPSPQKSRAVSKAKPDAVSIQKSKPEDKKLVSSSPFRGSKATVKNERSKMTVNSTPQVAKASERTRRPHIKGSLDKSNVEKSKNLVPNASVPRNKTVTRDVKKKSDKTVSESSYKKHSEPERPRTSTIRKGPPDVSRSVVPEQVQNLEQNMKHDKFSVQGSEMDINASEDEEDYEEDFEDYDSDFEASDADSTSDSSTSDSVPDEEDKASDSDTSERVKTTNHENYNSEKSKVNLAGFDAESRNNNSKEPQKSVEKTFLHLSDSSYLKDKTSKPGHENKIIKPSYSFINFASAVEQEREEDASNQFMQNSSNLSADDQLDILSLKNDVFTRGFEKRNCKNVYVQTDNQNEEETQTKEIETCYKWTQNPPSDSYGYGGDTSEDSSSELLVKSLFNSQKMKLSSFIQNCGKIFLTLLNEEFPSSSHLKNTSKRDGLFLSRGYYTLTTPEYLKDAPVLSICCHYKSSMTVLTIHDGAVKVPYIQDERCVVCVWNLLNNTEPEHVLVCHSQAICASFGPIGNDTVLAGTFDGSILLWDQSDSSQSLSDDFPLKVPSYNTALVSSHQNHHSCIIAIQTVVSSSTDETSSLSFAKTNASRNFHVLALEDIGVMNIWVVVEVINPDFSGLDSDLGLSPCGKLRLVKSSTLLLYNSSALVDIQKINIRTFDFCVVPFDSSRLLVTTDAGLILHVDRYGRVADPRFYSSDLEFSSEIRCICSSPHNKDLFLVGCSDGRAMLYNVNLVRPVLVLLLAAKGDPVSLIQWSPCHPSSFVVLSLSSSLHLWNLMEDTLHHVHSYDFLESRITWFTIGTDDNSSSQKSSHQLLYMCIALENGVIEIHATPQVLIEEDYSKQKQFMANL